MRYRSAGSRGVPAKPVADPAARRGEGDPQRIADDGEEQGGAQGQSHGRRAGRPAAMADDGYLGGGGAPAHLPHHVPVDRSPARRITGEKMMISGHRAREMTAWVVGLGRLIWPG